MRGVSLGCVQGLLMAERAGELVWVPVLVCVGMC